MLFLMVGCVFLGNGVVAWSGRQLRMDVIVGMMPPKARDALDLLAELVLIGTSLTIVSFAWPVIRDLFMFDQRSQSADVPHVHSAGPGADRALDHGAAGGDPAVDRRRSPRVRQAGALSAARESDGDDSVPWSISCCPAVLLILGLPIFLVLLVTCLCVMLFVADVPTEAMQTFLFSGLDNFPAAGGAVLRARRRDHGAGRHRAPRGGVGDRR